MPLSFKTITQNIYLRFPIRFFGLYLPLEIIYYVVISASHPNGKLYSLFVTQYLNIMNGIRNILIGISQLVLSVFNYSTTRYAEHGLMINTGGKVSVNNACLGYSIMAFWLAFIFANDGTWKMKAKWILTGLLAITIINVGRIVFLLIALNKKWSLFYSIDHHSAFNIVAYLFIFGLMYVFIRSRREEAI